jgi:hypothetical protein
MASYIVVAREESSDPYQLVKFSGKTNTQWTLPDSIEEAWTSNFGYDHHTSQSVFATLMGRDYDVSTVSKGSPLPDPFSLEGMVDLDRILVSEQRLVKLFMLLGNN